MNEEFEKVSEEEKIKKDSKKINKKTSENNLKNNVTKKKITKKQINFNDSDVSEDEEDNFLEEEKKSNRISKKSKISNKKISVSENNKQINLSDINNKDTIKKFIVEKYKDNKIFQNFHEKNKNDFHNKDISINQEKSSDTTPKTEIEGISKLKNKLCLKVKLPEEKSEKNILDGSDSNNNNNKNNNQELYNHNHSEENISVMNIIPEINSNKVNFIFYLI